MNAHVLNLEALALDSSRKISAASGPIIIELEGASLGEGLTRADAIGLGSEVRAAAWASYGFEPDDVAAWLAAGIAEPPVAAELRASHVEADDEDLAEEVDGMSWARALDEGHRTTLDFLVFQETGRVA